jgi:hypothetical protein
METRKNGHGGARKHSGKSLSQAKGIPKKGVSTIAETDNRSGVLLRLAFRNIWLATAGAITQLLIKFDSKQVPCSEAHHVRSATSGSQ